MKNEVRIQRNVPLLLIIFTSFYQNYSDENQVQRRPWLQPPVYDEWTISIFVYLSNSVL